MDEILKIINDISTHYESDKTYDKKDLVKLVLDHSSFEKFMIFFISSYEKEADITSDYINDILKDYNIEKSEVEKVFNNIKEPKEPSFNKSALIKKPSFTKVKDSQIENTSKETKPSFSNIPKSQNKIEIDKVKGNPKNTANKKNKTLKDHWNNWSNGQKIGYVVLCIIIFGVFSNIFNSSSTSKSNTNNSSTRCVGLDATGNYMDKVISRVENQGCGIGGYYFVGRGSYIVNSICPELDRARGRIGSIDIEVVVNKCGEIIKVNF